MINALENLETKHLVTALYEFRNLGIDFISYQENIDTSSPLGEAIFTIISAMSKLERDIIADVSKVDCVRPEPMGSDWDGLSVRLIQTR